MNRVAKDFSQRGLKVKQTSWGGGSKVQNDQKSRGNDLFLGKIVKS